MAASTVTKEVSIGSLDPTSSGFTTSGVLGSFLRCNFAREYLNLPPEFEFDIHLIGSDSSIFLRISQDSRVFINDENISEEDGSLGLKPVLLTAQNTRSLFKEGRSLQIRNGMIKMCRVWDGSFSMRACVDRFGMIVLLDIDHNSLLEHQKDEEEEEKQQQQSSNKQHAMSKNLSLIEFEAEGKKKSNNKKKNKRKNRKDYRLVRSLHLYEMILSRMNVVTLIELDLHCQPCEIGLMDFHSAVYLACLENPYMRSVFRITDDGEKRLHLLINDETLYHKLRRYVVSLSIKEEEESIKEAVNRRMKELRNISNESFLSDTSKTLFSMDVAGLVGSSSSSSSLLELESQSPSHYLICQLNHGCMDARGNFACVESVLTHLDRWLSLRKQLGLISLKDCTEITSPLMLAHSRGFRPLIDILGRVTPMIDDDSRLTGKSYQMSDIMSEICPLTGDPSQGVPFLELPSPQTAVKKAEAEEEDDNDDSDGDQPAIPEFGELRALHWSLTREQSENLITVIKQHSATVQGVLSAASVIAFLVMRRELMMDHTSEKDEQCEWVMRVQCPVQMSARVSPPIRDPMNCVCGSFATLWEVSVNPTKTTVLDLAAECTRRMRESISVGFPLSWVATMHGWLKSEVNSRLPGYSLMSSNVGMNPIQNDDFQNINVQNIVLQGGSFKEMIPANSPGCMIHLHTFDSRICVNANYTYPGLSDECGALYSRIHRKVFETLAMGESDSWLVSEAVQTYVSDSQE